MQTVLHLDLETFSSVSLKTCGLHKYVESPDFEILLLSYSFDKGPVICIDLTEKQSIPTYVERAIKNPNVIKKGWNIAFEFACLNKYYNGKLTMQYGSWYCTMVKCAYNGYPLGLEYASKILAPAKEKLKSGKDGIKFFCIPCKATKLNGMRTRNLPKHDPERWKGFKVYNIGDVEAEIAIDIKLPLELPEIEQRLYQIDQVINLRGISCDINLIKHIIAIDQKHRQNLLIRAERITGLMNANSVQQLQKWLQEETEEEIESLTKDNVKYLLSLGLKDHVNEVLEIRREIALSSVKKYKTMYNYADSQNLIKGLFQFYGAYRTGRWAGRGVQVHNLARQTLKAEKQRAIRKLIKNGADAEVLDLIYPSVSQILKELIRTAFVPKQGNKLFIGDYTAIEACVIAWLAQEEWRLELFHTGGKIYEASAARMLNIPVDQIGSDSPERQIGKVAELALGFQGAVGALLKMKALEMGLKEEELLDIVKMWRKANPNIVQLWYTAEKAFKTALHYPGKLVYFCRRLCCVQFKGGDLRLTLPAGRQLVYVKAGLRPGRRDDMIYYYGMNQTTKKWQRQDLYGGKIVENIVQATARDVLAEAMIKLHDAGMNIVMHVHDEIACEVDTDSFTYGLEYMKSAMEIVPEWAAGLPLAVKVFEADFYRKN